MQSATEGDGDAEMAQVSEANLRDIDLDGLGDNGGSPEAAGGQGEGEGESQALVAAAAASQSGPEVSCNYHQELDLMTLSLFVHSLWLVLSVSVCASDGSSICPFFSQRR